MLQHKKFSFQHEKIQENMKQKISKYVVYFFLVLLWSKISQKLLHLG